MKDFLIRANLLYKIVSLLSEGALPGIPQIWIAFITGVIRVSTQSFKQNSYPYVNISMYNNNRLVVFK